MLIASRVSANMTVDDDFHRYVSAAVSGYKRERTECMPFFFSFVHVLKRRLSLRNDFISGPLQTQQSTLRHSHGPMKNNEDRTFSM